ncbi:MAG: mitochondrial ATPase complex subunit ATP10 [Candidatus Thorarchaeota archaeon]|nr:mitochondrial ATPase complex subunit ATP10 [Candidatus Thorarchaeota archaeon]
MPKFPHLIAENLNQDKLEIPSQLKGKLNVVLVAFQQWHQTLVDSWIPLLTELMEKYSELDFYELPTIRKMNFVYRRFIDGGMRAGIRSVDTRKRTITLYIEKTPFKETLEIENEETIYVFLVDKHGEIFWRNEGAIDQEKSLSLRSTVKKLFEAS